MTRLRQIVLSLLSWGLLASSAWSAPPASPCPQLVGGISIPYSGSAISFVTYDQPDMMLTIIWYSTWVTTYSNVPYSVMQQFQTRPDPVATYNAYVNNIYEALLLQEQSNCPVLQESGGYIWVD